MISVTILTKNCGHYLAKTLESTRSFSEVIILDTGSTDDTLKVAKSFSNTVIHHSPFVGFGPSHNVATSFAKNDWILSIDSDEILSPLLIEELHSLALTQKAVYSIQRHNYFNGKHIKWCGGWHPDWVVRLYNRKQTRFTDAMVHEKIIDKGLNVLALKNPMIHVPYREMSDFLHKMQAYTTLFAQQKKGKSSLLKAILHSKFAFFKSYVLKRGFLGGKEGYIISSYNAHTAFYKYLKLSEKD